jgi:hypothetical protein
VHFLRVSVAGRVTPCEEGDFAGMPRLVLRKSRYQRDKKDPARVFWAGRGARYAPLWEDKWEHGGMQLIVATTIAQVA